MNAAQNRAYCKFVRDMGRTYPIIQVRYPPAPMTHVSIYVSRYYDMIPYERAQINDIGVITYT